MQPRYQKPIFLNKFWNLADLPKNKFKHSNRTLDNFKRAIKFYLDLGLPLIYLLGESSLIDLLGESSLIDLLG